MGRSFLLIAAAAALFGCQAPAGLPASDGTATAPEAGISPVSAAAVEAAQEPDPHAELACASCHNGRAVGTARAPVPRASCVAAGCHTDAGPENVHFATVTFHHRTHGQTGSVQPSCAGCHTHDEGGQPLRASVDACALCHLPELTSQAAQDCQTCHQKPQHVALTSAAVPVPHGMLPWTEVGCVRCHYDVSAPPLEVPAERCASCHEDLAAVTRNGIGADLHPSHSGLTCTSCHAEGTHSVRAMSSAVDLVCADCHTQSHDVALAGWEESGAGWPDSGTCAVCHTTVHRAQQQLLLGVLPDGRTMASRKFLAGLTCRSCHLPPEHATEEPIRGQEAACVSCHGAGYEQVLDWWSQGVAQRLRASSAYVARAQRELSGSLPEDEAAALAASVDMLSLVSEAGGQHNLELADRIFRESVATAAAAYRSAGRRPPAPPQLGNPPHLGLCTGCHYSGNALDIRQMPGGFHQDVLDAIERRAALQRGAERPGE